jgi:hypothetical protein
METTTITTSDNPQNVCKFHGSDNQTELCTICFCEGKESVTRSKMNKPETEKCWK